MFPRSFLHELRERLSLVSLINERVSLKKAGVNFKGLCPFHIEKSPSFLVSEEKQIFHCFGCGEGGDVITFFMKFEGMSFPEAVKLLADRVGLKLPTEKNKALSTHEVDQQRQRKWSLRLNQIALDYFAATLAHPVKGKKARDYLQERVIPSHLWKQHFLGYADKGWDGLEKHLKEKGAPLALAAELGLLRKKEGEGYYDFFRDRIIFPITSPRGEILGFGGRTLDEHEMAKYINSPDSLIYHKSSSVFGLSEAKNAIRQQEQVIIVEGYTDVLRLVSVGLGYVVAPLGTALTTGHLQLLTRYTKNMFLAFDGDEAGRRATLRTLPLFLEAGMMPRVVCLPKGEDPDSFVRQNGVEHFQERCQQARSLFEFFIDGVVEETGRDLVGKTSATRQILPLLEKVTDSIERKLYQAYLARIISVDEGMIQKAMEKKGDPILAPGIKIQRTSNVIVPSAERTLLEILIRFPTYIACVKTKLAAEDFLDEWCQHIMKVFLEQQITAPDVHLTDMLDAFGDPALAEELRAIAVAEKDFTETNVQLLVEDCIESIKRRSVMERMRTINESIRQAEVEHDETKLMSLLKTKQELTCELKVEQRAS
ncbi:MAG: DNA primase [Deltaproteobacteria bacterium RIFCSPLOWO2_02_FULL_44_10]|nr:MAG: DNA primase [Deltaproteobacteria bacterium RIFCSPHIGHO2_02_FULL_44_16]OGQ46116.1 MAG: DNA primase [Deltaproteobacteria bacterium RIFCSPLOWO2_02_FULL_44_10]